MSHDCWTNLNLVTPTMLLINPSLKIDFDLPKIQESRNFGNSKLEIQNTTLKQFQVFDVEKMSVMIGIKFK